LVESEPQWNEGSNTVKNEGGFGKPGDWSKRTSVASVSSVISGFDLDLDLDLDLDFDFPSSVSLCLCGKQWKWLVR
jgi:hypothetical protein